MWTIAHSLLLALSASVSSALVFLLDAVITFCSSHNTRERKKASVSGDCDERLCSLLLFFLCRRLRRGKRIVMKFKIQQTDEVSSRSSDFAYRTETREEKRQLNGARAARRPSPLWRGRRVIDESHAIDERVLHVPPLLFFFLLLLLLRFIIHTDVELLKSHIDLRRFSASEKPEVNTTHRRLSPWWHSSTHTRARNRRTIERMIYLMKRHFCVMYS